MRDYTGTMIQSRKYGQGAITSWDRSIGETGRRFKASFPSAGKEVEFLCPVAFEKALSTKDPDLLGQIDADRKALQKPAEDPEPADIYEGAARKVVDVMHARRIYLDTMDSYSEFYRQEFVEKFGPDRLRTLSEDKVLNVIYMGPGSQDSINNWLLNKTWFGFGNLGGDLSQFGPHYDFDCGHGWTAGGARSISEKDASVVASITRNNLVACCDTVEARIKSGTLKTREEYEKLQNEMGIHAGFAETAWVRKYLYMVYPEYFVSFYKEELITGLLKKLGVYPADSIFGNIWQLLTVENDIALLLGKDRMTQYGRMAALCWTMWSKNLL